MNTILVKILAFASCLFASKFGFAQSQNPKTDNLPKVKEASLITLDTTSALRVKRDSGRYKAYVVAGKKLLALTDNGRLVSWDLGSLSYRPVQLSGHKDSLISLSIDRYGKVYTSGISKSIYVVDTTTYQISKYADCPHLVMFIAFNKANKPFYITEDGVYELNRKKLWSNFLIHNTQFRWNGKKRGFLGADNIFVDQRDKLWMWTSQGEWGSDIQHFDLANERSIELRLDSFTF